MSKYKVYCLNNNLTNEKYIGVTKQKLSHRFKSGKGYKKDTKINKAIEKYGWENFEHIILFETEDKELAGEKERQFIKKYDTVKKGYNKQDGGFKNFQAAKHSKETLRRISEKQKGRHHSPNTEFKKGVITESTILRMKKVYCVELNKEFISITQAEKELGLSHHIHDCINGKRNTCGGYHWKLVGGEE